VTEINLLKPKSSIEDFAQLWPVIVSRFLLALLLGVVVYYVFLFFQMKTLAAETVKLQAEVQKSKIEARGTLSRDELLTRQSQLQDLDKLIKHHLYWSQLLPALAHVTLTSASYSSVEAFNEGKANLTVVVPNLDELDKFLQVFNNPKFNKNFYNLRIGAFHKIQNGNATAITFEVNLNFNTALLQPTNGN